MPEHSDLYWDRVFGCPEWLLSLAVVLLVVSCMVLFFWRPWVRSAQTERRTFMECFFLSSWLVLVGISGITWVCTEFAIHRRHGLLVALFLEGGFAALFVVILMLTFFLEGIEIAYTELRDKDEHQLEESKPVVAAINLIKSFSRKIEKRADSFYGAREWSVVSLLVLATLIIENDDYYLPFFAHVVDTDAWGTIARIAITVVLTTFPFIWFAQGPGKYVAGRNSVAFLEFFPTTVVIKGLHFLWTKIRVVGLEYPSEKTQSWAVRHVPGCEEPRNLPPNEFSFFADGLKKYGYGVLVSCDKVTICDDSSCHFESWTLFYVETPKLNVKKYFEYEAPFVATTVADLKNSRSGSSQYWAFEAPLIGERVDDELLMQWNSLLYAEAPDNLIDTGIIRSNLKEFRVIADPPRPSAPAKGRPTWRLDVILDFLKELPAVPRSKQGKTALLVLWKIKGKLETGVVELPQDGKIKPWPYAKKYSTPSLRSTVQIRLESDSKYRFAYPAKFSVTYEQVEHAEEQARFKRQYRPERQQGVPTFAEDLDHLSFFVDSPLPGGEYCYELGLTNRE